MYVTSMIVESHLHAKQLCQDINAVMIQSGNHIGMLREEFLVFFSHISCVCNKLIILLLLFFAFDLF